jgi:hypothetical protein
MGNAATLPNDDDKTVAKTLYANFGSQFNLLQCLGDEHDANWTCVACQLTIPPRRAQLLCKHFQDPQKITACMPHIIQPVIEACQNAPDEEALQWLNKECAEVLYKRVNNAMVKAISIKGPSATSTPTEFTFKNGCGCSQDLECPKMKVVLMLLEKLDLYLENMDKAGK